ncbi:MAG: ribonuclease III [Candidatus Woykebacteria bacterium GWB1_45_5]|uniref:Ribonuclease 3 n=2 Tax=Candidatus Woykeibacteriota TaxID=1817899 RepID=A0A1G1W3Q6_9BACT|nr:MAG: ribonuclease III [Candidatus Woykebacteria bacterium GWA1_44_8]OGY24469.1 MAG: ribonuclease III [Candidatus Woykebacteria bacterium GWB1_45_5]
MTNELEKLEKNLGFKFKNKNLLQAAFIHRSYLNEHPEEKLPHNERLEFLGDAVLGLVVSAYLYKQYPNHPEGDLTNFRSSLVNAKSLSQAAAFLKIGDYLYLSRGEETTGGRNRQYILANTFEALVGAIFLDQGVEEAKRFVQKYLLPHLPEIIEKKLYKDFKSLLQERAQEELSTAPIYKVLEEKGPDHAKTFQIGVYIGKTLAAQGKGSSKQTSEQEAARKALENWDKIG